MFAEKSNHHFSVFLSFVSFVFSYFKRCISFVIVVNAIFIEGGRL